MLRTVLAIFIVVAGLFNGSAGAAFLADRPVPAVDGRKHDIWRVQEDPRRGRDEREERLRAEPRAPETDRKFDETRKTRELERQAAGESSREAAKADQHALPRPDGIPDNWLEQPTKKGGGTTYYNPDAKNDLVRVMPGDPASPFESQRKPYVIDQKGGFRDVDGKPIPGDKPGASPEAHIPYDQFQFQR